MNKNILFIILFLSTCVVANDFNDLKATFLKKDYSSVCSKSIVLYKKYKNNSDFLNIFAVSCLKSDMVNKMMVPIIKLYRTKENRENATYFATILYKKKLLYYSLIDKVDISYINLPKTNYILSTIFDKYVKKNYTKVGNSYLFNSDKNKEIKYKLSIEVSNGIKKMYLRTLKNSKIIKTRIYW